MLSLYRIPPLAQSVYLPDRARAPALSARENPNAPPQTAHSFGKIKVYVICTYVNHKSDVTSLLRKPVVLL